MKKVDTKDYKIIKVPSIGLNFINGISSSYDDSYPHELLESSSYINKIFSKREDFQRVIRGVNNTILSYWPCNTIYVLGYGCAPCSLGLSLLCPSYCISMGEKEAHRYLEDVSLNARFYDKGIFFKLQKSFFSSWIEVWIPMHLWESSLDIETNVERSDYKIVSVDLKMENSTESGGFIDVNAYDDSDKKSLLSAYGRQKKM